MSVVRIRTESLDWSDLGRHRREAGLAYEKHRWLFPSASPRWSGGLLFEDAGGIALRDRWVGDGDRRVPAATLVDGGCLPSLTRIGLVGDVAPLVAALAGEAVLVAARPVGPAEGRVAGASDFVAACRALDEDPRAYLLPGGATGPQRLAARRLSTQPRAFLEFAALVSGLGWLATGLDAGPGVVLYGGRGLVDAVHAAATRAACDLEDDRTSRLVSALPAFDELPSATGPDVDLGGTNVGALPVGRAARSLVLDDSAVVDLRPLATWPELTSVSLRGLRLSDVAPVARAPVLALGPVEPTALLEIAPSVVELELCATAIADLTPLREARRLRRLTLRDVSSTTLAGIESLASLEHLEIVGDEAPGCLGALARLPALRSLVLRTRTALDVGALPPLPELTHLDLSGADGRSVRIGSPAALSRFTGLRSLALRTVNLTDVAWAPALTALASLDLGGSHVGDVAPLAALTSLEHLDVAGCPILDLGALRRLTALTALDVSHVDAADLELVTGLPRLEILGWAGAPLTHLRALARLDGLRQLRLARSALHDLGGVEALARLEHLDLDGTSVTTLAPLRAARALRVLRAASAGIADLAPVGGLPRLAELGLAGSAVTDLRPLAATTTLEHLSLAGLEVELAPLARNTGLAVLDLFRARFVDAEPLAALTGLRELQLTASSITTLAPLRAARALRVLDITDLGRDVDLAPLLDVPPLARLIVTDGPSFRAHPALAVRHHVTLRET